MSDIAATTARAAARLPAPAHWPARRTLQILLGAVWLLDAALQFQPYMFSRAFITNIIDPAAAGDPAAVAAPITWSAQLMAQHIVAANALFAVIQLAIAAGLCYRRTVRPALAASIAWSVMVWWFGEGLGGILTGASPLGPVVPRLLWLTLWAEFAWYLLLPANRAPDAVSHAFTSMTIGPPGWVQIIQGGLAGLTAGRGLAVSALLAALCALTASAIFADRLARPAIILACLLGLLFWAAEGFGGIATGQATDPNTGPLLILLAACFWPPRGHRPGPAPH